MTQLERLDKLNEYLLNEAPQYRAQAAQFGADEAAQFRLFRSLVNLRMPADADPGFLTLQDEYLQEALRRKGITEAGELPCVHGLSLWQGDCTTLGCDGIVNAANSGLLGCFSPCHGCIDNAIHTYAGIQLRLACAEIMKAQGHEEPAGGAKITPAYNLPSRYVLHTVGPIIRGDGPDEEQKQALASCYRACMALAAEAGCKSLAFCCISTGVFHFPRLLAAQIAIRTVRDTLEKDGRLRQVIFNVFLDEDQAVYARELAR